MLSVKALIACDNAKDNLRKQLQIKRRKVGFIIAFWIAMLSVIVLFFQAYVRGIRYKTVTDPIIIVMW